MEEIVIELKQLNQTLSSKSIDWTTLLGIVISGVISMLIATWSYNRSRKNERSRMIFAEILSPLNILLKEHSAENLIKIKELHKHVYFKIIPKKIAMACDLMIVDYFTDYIGRLKSIYTEIIERNFFDKVIEKKLNMLETSPFRHFQSNQKINDAIGRIINMDNVLLDYKRMSPGAQCELFCCLKDLYKSVYGCEDISNEEIEEMCDVEKLNSNDKVKELNQRKARFDKNKNIVLEYIEKQSKK